MKIIGIETSCDDTCVSLIEKRKASFKVLSNIVSSQIEIHKKWGGVYPTLAKREHEKNLPLVFKKAVKIPLSEITAVAVTVGPGLDPCLWTGINFAKKINLPIIPVNHIEAHLIVSFFKQKKDLIIPRKEKMFPAVGLIVSGGHTLLVLIKKINHYQLLGETRDDAAGECFDKTARLLGLSYPGGPLIASIAKMNPDFKVKLPRPMINTKDNDFSFSGLKTAALYRLPLKEKKYKAAMAYEIQTAIIDVLFKKTIKAARENKVRSIIIGGGVSANKELQKRFSENKEFKVFFPSSGNETDNALMIALTGFFKKPLKNIEAQPNLKI